jgi:diacylglycerol kinase
MVIVRSSPQLVEMEEMPVRVRSRRSWRERLRPACRGIKLGVRGHSRFFVHFFCSALVLASAVVLRCDLVQWCLLLGCIGIVFITELLSSAIVALYRGLDGESKSRAAPCLDIATGAVFLAILTASAIGSVVFLSRLVEMCAPALAE